MRGSSTLLLRKTSSGRSPTTCVDTKKKWRDARSRPLARPAKSMNAKLTSRLATPTRCNASNKSPMLELKKNPANLPEKKRERTRSDAESGRMHSSRKLRLLLRSRRKTMTPRSTLTLVATVRLKDLPRHSSKKANAKIKNARDS